MKGRAGIIGRTVSLIKATYRQSAVNFARGRVRRAVKLRGFFASEVPSVHRKPPKRLRRHRAADTGGPVACAESRYAAHLGKPAKGLCRLGIAGDLVVPGYGLLQITTLLSQEPELANRGWSPTSAACGTKPQPPADRHAFWPTIRAFPSPKGAVIRCRVPLPPKLVHGAQRAPASAAARSTAMAEVRPSAASRPNRSRGRPMKSRG